MRSKADGEEPGAQTLEHLPVALHELHDALVVFGHVDRGSDDHTVVPFGGQTIAGLLDVDRGDVMTVRRMTSAITPAIVAVCPSVVP